MTSFKPRLMESSNRFERMDALCEFIEFWLGPRQADFGEPAEEVRRLCLPMPLRRLYEFAGRWPGFDARYESRDCVGAFSIQDALSRLNKLEFDDQGKVSFLTENQGCWVCKTLLNDEDPPVWCDGDRYDSNGEVLRGEQMVCDALSPFLVTFILQEITLGSRCHLLDDGLSDSFEADREVAVPVWRNGPYVHGADTDFFLWNGALVANLWGSYFFAANHPSGIEFLTSHQGPVVMLGLMAGTAWRLDVRKDGSAELSFHDWPLNEKAESPPGTFRFEELRQQLTDLAVAERPANCELYLFLHRQGQNSTEGRPLTCRELVRRLFRQALEHARKPNRRLQSLFRDRY